MKKIILTVMVTGTILTACSNDQQNVNENESKEESNIETENKSNEEKSENNEEAEFENTETEIETTTYTLEQLNGTYMLTTDEDKVRVVFDNGVLRYTDNRGNISYRLSDSGDRLILAIESPNVYLIKNNEFGINLINIDDNGKVTGNDIILETME